MSMSTLTHTRGSMSSASVMSKGSRRSMSDSTQTTQVKSRTQKQCDIGLVDQNILIDDRSCTDRFFLVLFVAFGLLTVFGIYTISQQARNAKGEIGISFARATRLSDFQGNVCGEGVYEDRGLAFFPILPGSTFENSFESAINYRICVSDCKKTFSKTQDDAPGPNVDVLIPYLPFLTDTAGYPTRPLADRVCIPDLRGLSAIIPDELEEAGKEKVNELKEAISELVAVINTDVLGVIESWEVFPIAIGVSMGVFLVYMGLLALCGGIMIWVTAIIVGALIFAFPVWVILGADLDYGDFQLDGFDETITSNQEYWRYAAYAMLGVGVIYVLVLAYLRKRIAVAIEILKFSTRAIMGVPTLLVFPLLWLAAVVAYVVCWLIGFLILDQIRSNPEDFDVPNAVNVGGETFELFQQSDTDVILRNIHIFGLVWNLQFLYYFSYYVVSGTVSTWYFSRDRKTIPGGTVLTQIWRAIRYHMGTIAFGALLMAIIKVLRFLVRQTEKKTKGKSNKITRALFGCVTCCLYCFETIIDRISKNGLVYTAIFGYPLWRAGMEATGMMSKNLARAAAVGVIGKYSIFVGKLFVTLGTGSAAFGLLDAFPEFRGENQILTLVAVMVVGYIVSISCFNVFDVAIDTVFLCYIYDEAMVDKHGKMYASGELQSLVRNHTNGQDLYDPETGLVYNFADMTYKKDTTTRSSRSSRGDTTRVSYKTNTPIPEHIGIEMDTQRLSRSSGRSSNSSYSK